MDTQHRGVITTILGGGASMAEGNSSRRRGMRDMLVVHMKADTTSPSFITFSERDMRYKPPKQDEPMVISVVTVEYKVERLGQHPILVDLKRLGIPPTNLELYLGMLYEFASEQVMIKGVIKLETTFGERHHTRSIPVLYMVVDVEASYNIIIGRPGLNKLGAVVSTLHLCMKYLCYEDSLRIGFQPSRVKEPTINSKHGRPLLGVELKEVIIGPSPTHKTKIGATLIKKDEGRLVAFLWKNKDVFAWSPADMLGIDPKFLCNRLSVTARWMKLVEEACGREAKGHQGGGKQIACNMYPTWLANVVTVKKPSGKWKMCTNYTDLYKACPKDPYLLPNINWLVDGASGFTLLSFMDVYSGYNQIIMHPGMKPKLPS
ncbi:hypothetical protein CR513_05716, partial [Mucuna pruriens]